MQIATIRELECLKMTNGSASGWFKTYKCICAHGIQDVNVHRLLNARGP